MLPEEVSIITEEQRDWDDTYRIDSGRSYCFEFTLDVLDVLDFSFIHTRPQSQDLSLRCWFSETPNGQQEFPFEDHMDVFHMQRHARTISIGATLTDAVYKMPALQKNYLMVQNMQNAENFFKLAFTLKA